MSQLPSGSVVEVNHVFDNNCVRPVLTNPLPDAVAALVWRNAVNIENTYAGIRARDLNRIFESFLAQPLCSSLTLSEGEQLFREMIENTRSYLEPWYDLGQLS